MITEDYNSFLARKGSAAPLRGFDAPLRTLRGQCAPWQARVVRWALHGGQRCIFAGTGLGKTRMELAWADAVCVHTGDDVLILAPLAVTQQTVREGERIGIPARYCRAQTDVQPGITVANYDMLHAFDPGHFTGIVLDEASILKAADGKTRARLMEGFAATPYKLSCTATPAPNDHIELGTQAAFIGVMSIQEMLATFFVHDGGSTQDWRLKGHARADFWQWVASWAMLFGSPDDIGYPDDRYILPPLHEHTHGVSDGGWASDNGYLFAPALSLTESRAARKASMRERIVSCAALVNRTRGQWIIWCALNQEGDDLTKAIPGATQVAGSDTREHKEQTAIDFMDRKIRVLVSKSSIFGYGLNLQNCHQMAFVGVDFSWESYYQAVRRCWRFGQNHPVDVHLFLGESEASVLDTLHTKQFAADAMAREMIEHMADTMKHNLEGYGALTHAVYDPQVKMAVPAWLEGGRAS